ncbi:unnamed protein product [Rhizoctonia solani]|uniref:Uncharacterized protein n=1 Tax=Rhizoctonia solani TaxID=456999 RepID=A0A8H3GYW3_9AGAM|nr:unnamed protein product [Rhizoctonia solani]
MRIITIPRMSGTILDVIGSVGGLFALLQTIHVVLFGRPLLWGLTGAKLITPFGILGAFGSETFKRRLRDHYHRRSAKDGSIKIRTTEFLRDFVIDFGPADMGPEQQPSQRSALASLTLTPKEEHNYSIPLMQLGSDATFRSLLQEDTGNDSDQDTIPSAEHGNEVV